MRSQNISLPAYINQEKVAIFAKKMNIENVQFSRGWLRLWKGRNLIKSKTILRESSAAHGQCVALGISLIFFVQITWKTFTLWTKIIGNRARNFTKSFVTTRNANDLGCANHRQDFELFLKSWKSTESQEDTVALEESFQGAINTRLEKRLKKFQRIV